MEDLVWIIIAVVGVFASIASKAAKMQRDRAGQSQEAPKWPGPVAGPRPGQGPTWAPPPGNRPAAPTPWPPKPAEPAKPVEMKREAPKTLVSGDVFTRSLDAEGYGTEGVGSEGPAPDEGVQEELSRFDRESEQMERRQLSRLTDDLVKPDDAPAVVTAGEEPSADLQAALVGSENLGRAIVLAEVLGRPKALRGRSGRRG